MTNENIAVLQFDTRELGDEQVHEKVSEHGDMSLMHQFHRASQLADELFVAELRECKLTPRQYVVLSAVKNNVGASQTKIVQLTGIDRSTIADIIRRMVNLKLLSRKRMNHDARAYSVSVTGHGEEILRTAQKAAVKVDQALLSRLTREGGAELQASLAVLSGDQPDQ